MSGIVTDNFFPVVSTISVAMNLSLMASTTRMIPGTDVIINVQPLLYFWGLFAEVHRYSSLPQLRGLREFTGLFALALMIATMISMLISETINDGSLLDSQSLLQRRLSQRLVVALSIPHSHSIHYYVDF